MKKGERCKAPMTRRYPKVEKHLRDTRGSLHYERCDGGVLPFPDTILDPSSSSVAPMSDARTSSDAERSMVSQEIAENRYGRRGSLRNNSLLSQIADNLDL